MKKAAATSSFSRRQLASSLSTPTFSTAKSFQQQTGSYTRYKKSRPATACASFSTLTTGRQRVKQSIERPVTADQRLVWSRQCSKRANARSGLSLAVDVGTRHTSNDVIITQLSPPGVEVRHSYSPVSNSDSLFIENDDGCSSSSSEIGYESFRSATKSVFPVTLLKSRYVNGGSLFSGMSLEARTAYDQLRQELLTSPCSFHSNDERSIRAANERQLDIEPRRHRSSTAFELRHHDNNSTPVLPSSPSALGVAVPEIKQETVCISGESRQLSPSGKQCWTEAESSIPDVKITILVQRPERDSTLLNELPPGLSSRSRQSSSAFLRPEIPTNHDRFRRRSMPVTLTTTDDSGTVDALMMTSGTDKNSSEIRTEPLLRPKDFGRVNENENESISSRNSRTNHFRITSAGYDCRYAGTGQLSASKRLASAKSAFQTVVVVRKDRNFNDDVTQQLNGRTPGGSDGESARSKSTETDEDPIELSIAKCRAWLNDGFEVSCFDRITVEPTV